ncbi:MAG: hypothetical protein WC582_04245 [Patescibacteria group bacterium]
MLFSELNLGDWFVLSEAVESGKSITMIKLEFQAQPMAFSGELRPFTAIAIHSGSFFSVSDDVEVVRISRHFEELVVGDRFVLVEDFRDSRGVNINKKVERPSDKPSHPGPVYFAQNEKYGSMIVPPPNRKVIRIE